MLVYDGRQNVEETLGCLQAKINAQKTLQLQTGVSPRKLIWNRTLALAALVGINTVTYFAIKALLGG